MQASAARAAAFLRAPAVPYRLPRRRVLSIIMASPGDCISGLTVDQQATAREVLAKQQQLLDSIDNGDYATYQSLCAADITCFEPESQGHLVAGLPFHKFFFARSNDVKQSTISSPHVRLMANDCVAVVSYVRLQQCRPAAGGAVALSAAQETRVWEARGGAWKCVHLHRAPAQAPPT